MWWFNRKRRVKIEIGYGEAIDRYTILAIKVSRMKGDKQKAAEAAYLEIILALSRAEVRPLTVEETHVLLAVNDELWDIEDEIRKICECEDLKERCVSLAQKVYRLNDHRAELKRSIDKKLGSTMIEVKSHVG